MSKPNVLILGGCGFIGSTFAKYVLDNDLANFVRIADKKILVVSQMMPDSMKVIQESKICECAQLDLAKEVHAVKAFGPPKDYKEDELGDDEEKWSGFDYIFNCCGETQTQKTKNDFKMKNIDTIQECIKEAKKHKSIKKWVEISDAGVYSGKNGVKQANSEDSKCEPITLKAEYRLKAEELLQKSELPHVILRPALVYGPGDMSSLTPRIICGAVYRWKNEKMKFIWTAKRKMNTVHITDVVNAMWFAAKEFKDKTIWNLADKGDSTQGLINGLIGEIYGVKATFMTGLISKAAVKIGLDGVASMVNNKHVPSWQRLKRLLKFKDHSLITPYIDAELLKPDWLYIDGTAISTKTNFKYKHDNLTKDLVKEQIQKFIDHGYFPEVDKIKVGGIKDLKKKKKK